MWSNVGFQCLSILNKDFKVTTSYSTTWETGILSSLGSRDDCCSEPFVHLRLLFKTHRVVRSKVKN